MTELEIDQSHLPRVQEVCQCFAVLEDGALAHNLQEQEIEQYYTTNVLKSQLVQNDIRIAKLLQDEEEERQSQERALLCQTTRRLEDSDSEYARLIQEQIQAGAEEEARRREQEDEEIAKRIQEEEEQRVRRRSRRAESLSDDSAGSPSSSSPHRQHRHSRHPRSAGGTQHPSTTTGWQHSTTYSHERRPGSPQGRSHSHPVRRSSRRSSLEGHTRGNPRETAGLRNASSGDSDPEVFLAPLPSRPHRSDRNVNTALCRRSASLRQPSERSFRSLHGQSSFGQDTRGKWRGHREGVWEEEGGHGEFAPEKRKEKRRSDEEYGRSRGNEERSRPSEVRQRRYSTSSDSSRNEDGHGGGGGRARSWTYREGSDRHVHFQEDANPSGNPGDRNSQVWAMLGQLLRERGVAVRQGVRGAPLQLVRPAQVCNAAGAQAPNASYQRTEATSRSYLSNGLSRSLGKPANGDGGQLRAGGGGRLGSMVVEGEIRGEDPVDPPLSRDRGGSRWWRGETRSKVKAFDREQAAEPSAGMRSSVRRSVSERWHGRQERQEQPGGEERREKREERRESIREERREERGEERPPRRSPRRTQSLFSREARDRPRARQSTAGGVVQPQPEGASLDLGELHQVLQDEELARRLQEEEEAEEEQLQRRSPRPSQSPHHSYPAGDFRAAQVAQDEEIARFIQKQEMKSKRRSRELQGPNSWRETKDMPDPPQDRRTTIDRRQVQRDVLNPDGLPFPTEDYPPEIQPPSPVVDIPQELPIRNIAEELDPTFRSRSQGKESLREEAKISAGQPHATALAGINDYLEEPTFIPPTKRQSDKSGRPKSKEKNCKQQ